jgi:hypothetical protein
MKLETVVRGTARAAALAAVLVPASPARAQSTGTGAPGATPPFWELVGGYEGDSHESGYGFLGPTYNRPLSDKLAITGRVFGTFLHYRFDNGGGGETTVHSPGIGPAIGLVFGHGTTFKATVGYSGKNEHREATDGAGRIVSDDTHWIGGVSLGGELYWNLGRRDNVQALANYSSSDDYLWSRAGYKRQVSNGDWKGHTTWYVGGEVITQGNADIWSNSIGALAELLLVPSHVSVMFRAGYKHSSFDIGAPESGPYFGVGIYNRF